MGCRGRAGYSPDSDVDVEVCGLLLCKVRVMFERAEIELKYNV